MGNQVIVLDFGGHNTQIVARMVREDNVYSMVLPGDVTEDEIACALGGSAVPGAILFVEGPGETRREIPSALPALRLGCPVMRVSADGEINREDLRRFLFDAASLEPSWNMKRFVENTVSATKARVGSSHVLSAVSGGVDSTIATVLVGRAIGKNLHCIMVDHGLLRKDEASNVTQALAGLGIEVQVVQAAGLFYDRLKGVTDPEEKRRVIGNGFIEVFQEEAQKLGPVKYMVQGTIYPDVLESGSRMRPVIKSHHNVGALPENMNLKLLEPLRELFKDEVREAGRALGLPAEFVDRHPFPGPGLAVRVLGEVTPDKVARVRQAQDILDQEIRRAGWYDKVWQCFCVLPGVHTVGTTGTSRTYGHLMAIRAVCSEDAMTAGWARLPYDLLDRVSDRITEEVPGVNRVVFDISSKPPSTIEWE